MMNERIEQPTAKVKTLSELNATGRTREWDALTLKREYAVSTMNRRAQGFSSTGTHLHLAIVETVIARSDEQEPGKVKVGDIFSVHPFCNGNGQRRGGVVSGADTDRITCKKCLKALEHISQMGREVTGENTVDATQALNDIQHIARVNVGDTEAVLLDKLNLITERLLEFHHERRRK